MLMRRQRKVISQMVMRKEVVVMVVVNGTEVTVDYLSIVAVIRTLKQGKGMKEMDEVGLVTHREVEEEVVVTS